VEWQWNLGAFDPQAGKLRETFTPAGSPAVRETYIDGGHPYWGMQAFALWMIPPTDELWTASERDLPVERNHFRRTLHGPGMVLCGNRTSGEVRLYQAKSSRVENHYRDKYNKFVYSSAFPFAATHAPDRTPHDNALVLFNLRTGASHGRGPITAQSINGVVEIRYSIRFESAQASVTTRMIPWGDFDGRIHRIEWQSGPPPEHLEWREGSYARAITDSVSVLRVWPVAGWLRQTAESLDGNIIHGNCLVQTLAAPAKAVLLASLHFASPVPQRWRDVEKRASLLRARIQSLLK